MDKIDQLANQHIREYESRLLHIDELLHRVDKGKEEYASKSEIDIQLEELRAEREKLSQHIEDLKQKSFNEWQVTEIEQAGPMIIWDAVAKRLEKLVERIEH